MSQIDPMIEVFVFENQQLLDTLENVLLEGEREHALNAEQINEVFRVMHTIKGSAAMMSYDGMARISHAVEDLFAHIREKTARGGDWNKIFDIVLSAADMIKRDVATISGGDQPKEDGTALIAQIRSYLDEIINGAAGSAPVPGAGIEAVQSSASVNETSGEHIEDSDAPYYKIRITFEPDCMMEGLRAFGVVNDISPMCVRLAHVPEDLMSDEASGRIVKSGFLMYIQSVENPDKLKQLIDSTLFLSTSSLILIAGDNEEIPENIRLRGVKHSDEQGGEHASEQGAEKDSAVKAPAASTMAKQNFISVNVNKLDKLMDLVGEIVTTEAMVTKNPQIAKLNVEGFERASQQLRKQINDLQDVVMSIRMVPVSTSFHKMQRIVRDMSKKVGKEVQLNIIGEETEVDKKVIDNLNDPLMHLIRNAVDHGIETPAERVAKGKPAVGQLTLEARNTGGDVMIIVTDDGRGMDRSVIVRKAIEKGLTTKTDAEISDKEAFAFAFAPGFSTKESVTEFSGRGVGMDVVRRNIEKIGGSIAIESIHGGEDSGTSVNIRIPLTLAIIEGMKLRVGELMFIVPMLTIREAFKPDRQNILLDPDGSEMIMIRGECHPVFRLHRLFNLKHEFENLEDGILVMLHSDEETFCLFVDELIGEQQAVIKPLPKYIQHFNDNMHGIGGCAVLGDGSISLIVDINTLLHC